MSLKIESEKIENAVNISILISFKNIRMANKVQPVVWKPADIGIELSGAGIRGRRLKLLKLFQPVNEGTCEIMQGETPQEMAENLALTLRKEKIL